jgi:predicted  nucleic acid-binding Zn-ribbon protein
MQEEETEQLDDIHEEVKGSHAQLGAINERTRNMESKLDDMAANIDDNEADINELQDSVKRNTTIVTGVTGGISMVLLWISDKVTRVL